MTAEAQIEPYKILCSSVINQAVEDLVFLTFLTDKLGISKVDENGAPFNYKAYGINLTHNIEDAINDIVLFFSDSPYFVAFSDYFYDTISIDGETFHECIRQRIEANWCEVLTSYKIQWKQLCKRCNRPDLIKEYAVWLKGNKNNDKNIL